MDRPASVTAAILGVVLIAVSAPFALDLVGNDRTFLLTWTEGALAEASADSAAEGETVAAEAATTDDMTSTLVVTAPTCTDGASAPLQEPARLTWTLRRSGVSSPLETGSLTCSDAADYEESVVVTMRPELAKVSAGDDGEAKRAALGRFAHLRESSTYTLEFTWDRPSVVPLPLPGQAQPAFDATMRLEVRHWDVVANEKGQEDVR